MGPRGRIALALLGVVLGLLPQAAVARTSRPRMLVLRPTWQVLRGDIVGIAADDRYVVTLLQGTLTSRLVVTDQETGRRRSWPTLGCISPHPYQLIIGGPWVMLPCLDSSYVLHDVASGPWRTVATPPQCGGPCRAVAVGRYWVRLVSDPNSQCARHCPQNYYLQSLRTGKIEKDPAKPGGRIFDDLNSISGIGRLCSPLRYPRSFELLANRWTLGFISFYGPFALTHGFARVNEPLVVDHLRRCGSRLNLSFEPASTAASSSAVVWTEDGAHPQGRLLPNLQPFVIRVPRAFTAGNIEFVALTLRTLIADDVNSGRFWTADLSLPSEESTVSGATERRNDAASARRGASSILRLFTSG
jgi:hypothetical protein